MVKTDLKLYETGASQDSLLVKKNPLELMQNINFCSSNLKNSILSMIFGLFTMQVAGMEGSAPESKTERKLPARLHYLEVPMAFAQGLKPLDFGNNRKTLLMLNEDDRQFAERENTLRQYSSSLASTEELGGPWDSGLAEQLLTVGILEQEQGNHIEAIKALGRAVQINRITAGLYTLDQVSALKKMIESFIAAENWQDADLYQNYLFFIEHKAYWDSDPRIIDSLERLALWNMKMFAIGFGEALGVRLSNAQMLFSAAIRMIVTHFGESDQRLPGFLKSLAASAYQVKIYPEYAVEVAQPEYRSQQESFRQKLDEGTPIIPGSFRIGEAALAANVNYHQVKSDDTYALAEAITHLADWYLLFGVRRKQLESLYEQAWKLLRDEEDGDKLLQRLFGAVAPLPTFVDAPKNFQLRLSDIKIRSGLNHSVADLSFSVTNAGAVRDIKLLSEETEENARRLARVSRDARMTKFRPILEEGRPVASAGHIFRYRYWY